MDYKIGKSSLKDAKRALSEATSGLQSPKLILFFSGVEQFEEYTIELRKAFPKSLIMGTTTFVALCKAGAYKETLLVLGIESGIECYGNVLEEVDKYPIKYVNRVEACVNQFSNTSHTMCFEFCTGLINSEEHVLNALNAVIAEKGIPLVGGSTGDSGIAEKTMLSYNGVVYDKACAFVLIKNLGGAIRLYKEIIYRPTNHFFTATKVDVKERIVYEYDHKPAAEVMAKALGTTLEKLPQHLDSHPVARIIGDELYITANKLITKNKGIAYHARVYNNAQMVLLEPLEYRKVNEETIAKIKKEVPKPAFSLVVHCLARSALFEGEQYINEFAKKMSDALGDYIGFSGYGEQMNVQNFNHTMVVAVFE